MSNKKKEFFLVRWFKRCFLGDRPELSDEEEERIQTPMRAMVANFVHRPLAMIGLIVFLAIFVFVMVGPHIWVLDLSEQDSTLTNLPPSHNMMEVPKALLANGVKDISSGFVFGFKVSMIPPYSVFSAYITHPGSMQCSERLILRLKLFSFFPKASSNS